VGKGGRGPNVCEESHNRRVGPGRQGGHVPKVCESRKIEGLELSSRWFLLQNTAPVQWMRSPRLNWFFQVQGPETCYSSETMHLSTKVRLGAIVEGLKSSKTMHLSTKVRLGAIVEGGTSSKTMHLSTKVRLGAIVEGGKSSKTMHLCSGSDRQGRFEVPPVRTARTARTAQAHYRNLRVD